METTVPIEDLRAAGFGDEVEKVARAVAECLDDGTGPDVAIISEPYAGRDALLRYAESLLDVDAVRVELDPSAAVGDSLSAPGCGAGIGEDETRASDYSGGDAVVNDGGVAVSDGDVEDTDGDEARAGALIAADCHHLFERHIDEFETLDAFLERLALSDALVVTSCNRSTWTYLDEVRDGGDSSSVAVEIPRLDAGELRTVIKAQSGTTSPRRYGRVSLSKPTTRRSIRGLAR